MVTMLFHIIIVYYINITEGQFLVRSFNAKPLKLTELFQLHNLLSTTGLILLHNEHWANLNSLVYNHGFVLCYLVPTSLCSKLDYLILLELLNQVLGIDLFSLIFDFVKKKTCCFTHAPQCHFGTLLCYSQLMGRTSVEWVPISA